MKFYNYMGKILIGCTVAYFVIGISGIVDGVRSVLNGGYADNIVLGAIIAFVFPLASLAGYAIVKSLEQDERRRTK